MRSLKGWSHRVIAASVTGSLLASTAVLTQAAPAQAQAAYGSYIGIGAAVGLTRDSTSRGDNFSGVIAGRYRILETPVSIRGQAFVFGSSFAFVPTVSYDFPLDWQTEAYLGAGVSFAGNGSSPSPVGDKTAFVLQPGIDYALPNSNLVIFGNAVFAFGAYQNGGGTAVSVQGGVGMQF